MVATSFFLAASSIVSVALGAPIVRRQAKNYSVFGGDGSMGQGWPSSSGWLSFKQLWELNEPIIAISCTQFGAANPEQPERTQIREALETVAGETGIDSRFLLAVMMQESKGCPRAPTTNYGQNNPGLMQSFNGRYSCNPDGVNKQNPCPKDTIVGMIREGSGKDMPFGLQQALEQSQSRDDSKYYKAARIYNSGSVAASGNLGDGIATHCYATDIANRLVGWPSDQQHPSSCDEHAIMGAQGSGTAYAGGAGAGEQAGNAPPVVTPEETPETPVTPPVQVGNGGQGNTPITPPVNNAEGPKIPGAAANCKSWYTVKQGDHCGNINTSFETLRKLNPALDANCSNLWLGYSYCTSA